MKFNVNETIKKAEEDGLIRKNSFFKPQEGSNRIRLLSPCIPYKSVFKGQERVQFVCWILDRADGVIKLYFMPQTILDMIGGLQMSDDFGFEEVPMPYDITINAVGAGDKSVKYSVVGARSNTPLTAEELAAYEAKDSIDKVIEDLRKEQSNGVVQQINPQPSQPETSPAKAAMQRGMETAQRKAEEPVEDISVEDIPF